MTLTEYLDERTRLASAASKGPWRVVRETPEFMLPYDAVVAADGRRSRVYDIDTGDAAFIADARESLPRAIAMLRVCVEALEHAECEPGHCRKCAALRRLSELAAESERGA